MKSRHDPDPRFVDSLEWQLRSEMRRRRDPGLAPRGWRVLRAAALVVVSIACGAVAVTAQQRLEDSWRRELAVTRLQVQLELFDKRAELYAEEVERIRQQVAMGTTTPETLAHMELQLAEVEAQARQLTLDLEQIQASGREGGNDVSAPVADGRDFFSERIRVQAAVDRQYLELARQELVKEQRRQQAGLIDGAQVASVETMVREAEERLVAHAEKLEIRRAFVEGEISAVEAELRIMKADADRNARVLEQQQRQWQMEMERLRERLRVGVEDELVAKQMELRLAEIEAQLRLAELEKEVLQRELEAQRQR